MKNNKLSIYRPLVFLCGPAVNKANKMADRRVLLSNYLLTKVQNISVGKHDIPFYMIPIVDDILDENFMNAHDLEYKRVEEIIAIISQRTYIFLDSLSTSYELGLFDSTLSRNITTVFLEKTYPKRKRRTVGEYILKSVSPKNIVCYDFSYEDKTAEENEFISFPNGKNGKPIIPNEVIKRIGNDFDSLKNKAIDGFEVEFTSKDASKLNQIVFSYFEDLNTISFTIGTRLAFYLSLLCLSNKEKNMMNESNDYSAGYEKFKRLILDLFISCDDAIKNFRTKQLMLLKPNINIRIGKHDDSDVVFKYFICIANRISFLLNQDFDDSFKSLKTNINIMPSFKKDDSFFDSFFDLEIHEKQLIDDYYLHPSRYIDEIFMVISSKKRKIVKYKNSHKGRHLRRIHEKIASLLQRCFVPSKYAFAYKKESSIKKCIEQHIDSSSFLKLDIHSFFNSITLKRLSELLKKRFKSEMEGNHKNMLPSIEKIQDILKCCFYHKKLPLGFVTSPILSDIFMNETDSEIGETFNELIYTRYADDILISSNIIDYDLSKCSSFIERKIGKLGLTLNSKKKARVQFKNLGDSIHYLGVNIVHRKDKNELTISKRTLISLSNKINKEINKLQPDISKIRGIELFVSNISEKSFSKLRKTYLAIFKSDLPLY